ncbi:PepSY domain-containing protein [Cyanobium gracile UHCC 0139]|uniref:PepSY domain-containing protein n=1 Tax=Cyanobium gracile UHCC 0139 TaxID=3110308 RepID=A0ABU5RNU8_9CYAN|nr:PepSY domain-containing protein [Cyanobium gracile]MEA5389751.1 PepSY domain-containing protein [Cyanobium gracile UHCC 0139]
MSRRIVLTATAFLLSAGVGLGMAAVAGARSTSAVVAQASGAGNSAGITAARAAAIALQRVPGGTVVDVDPGSEDGQAVWEVLVRRADNTGIEFYLKATTGEILRQERESLPPEALRPGPAVTAQRAITTAAAAVPGGRVIAIDLDTENGRTVWDVDVAGPDGPIEVTIDAATGRILQQRRAD